MKYPAAQLVGRARLNADELIGFVCLETAAGEVPGGGTGAVGVCHRFQGSGGDGPAGLPILETAVDKQLRPSRRPKLQEYEGDDQP